MITEPEPTDRGGRLVSWLSLCALAVVLSGCGSDSGSAPSVASREAAMITNLASLGITLTPAGANERAMPRKPAGRIRTRYASGPLRVRRDAAVYLGTVPEVRAGPTGHRSYEVVEHGSIPADPSSPADRLVYVVQLRNVAACIVEISCLTGGQGRASEEYDSFIDARTGKLMSSDGLAKGYDPNHPHARPRTG